MSGHIINDFKDLRSLIGEITKADPAKTTYQQNAKKMGVMQEADEAKPEDDKKAKVLKGRKDHAGEEEIKKAYMQLGRAAQGSVEYQRKLIQKELAKMGYKTYSKFAFDDIFKFENTQLESVLSDMQNIVKTKGAKKINGIMVDLFTASIITKAYDKVNDANKAKMEKANLQTLVQLSHRLMGMKEELQLDESKMGDLLIDIQSGATAKELVKYHNISLQTAKNFLSDYYASKRTRTAPGLKKEENIQEGTWTVPDSQPKLAYLQKMFLNKPIKGTEKNARTLLVNIYNIFGDDQFYDDVDVFIDTPDESKDLRNVIISNLSDWGVKFSGYKITHAPETWATSDEGPTIGVQKKFEDMTSEGAVKRGRGNIKKPKGKMVALKMSREKKLKEEKEHAEQSPFKLKSQAYPRAVSINTDGFGHRHATVEDIIAACDSFGMIIDKELQVEQVQKELGKNGFISFKQADLEDVFDERETQRVILALETVVEEQDPIEYTRDQVEDAYIMGEEIEFLKPDGLKTAGKVLKLSGNTFNVKDKFTGKSFTYKYINEEKEVKTFTEVINEVSIGDAGIRKDFPNVWAQKDKRLNNILMALVNLHGYNDNIKSYRKDKKKFVDSLKKIGKNDASLKKAGLTKKNIGEDIQEGRFSKQLIKQAGGIAFDKRYYMGNMSGAIKAIEKLKKGLSDDPKVREMLRIANESNETTDYTNWLPEGGDKEAYQKFFNAALKKFGVSSPDELEGDKKKEFFDYVDKNWKADHEEVEQDIHKSYKVDGRRKNFKEKMRKLGYIKGR